MSDRPAIEHEVGSGNVFEDVGFDQPRLSRLYGGRIAGMSTDKLLEAVARLGGHVTIRVEPHPTPGDAGRVELEVA